MASDVICGSQRVPQAPKLFRLNGRPAQEMLRWQKKNLKETNRT